jgi:hypothetical protein
VTSDAILVEEYETGVGSRDVHPAENVLLPRGRLEVSQYVLDAVEALDACR